MAVEIDEKTYLALNYIGCVRVCACAYVYVCAYAPVCVCVCVCVLYMYVRVMSARVQVATGQVSRLAAAGVTMGINTSSKSTAVQHKRKRHEQALFQHMQVCAFEPRSHVSICTWVYVCVCLCAHAQENVRKRVCM